MRMRTGDETYHDRTRTGVGLPCPAPRYVLVGLPGAAVRWLQRAGQEQMGRRARARMMSAAPLPPQFITFDLNVGECDRLHAPTPLPRDVYYTTFFL